MKLEKQNQVSVQGINEGVTISEARIFDDYWIGNCQALVELTTKFLRSMRRLQKAVHKKEVNVQGEKKDFELAKKDLEVKVKEIKTQLENQP